MHKNKLHRPITLLFDSYVLYLQRFRCRLAIPKDRHSESGLLFRKEHECMALFRKLVLLKYELVLLNNELVFS